LSPQYINIHKSLTEVTAFFIGEGVFA